jgi:hypothetical protein
MPSIPPRRARAIAIARNEQIRLFACFSMAAAVGIALALTGALSTLIG